MARIIDAKYTTLVGTPQQLRKLLGLLKGGSSIVDLKFANLVVLDKPIDAAELREALEATPRRQK